MILQLSARIVGCSGVCQLQLPKGYPFQLVILAYLALLEAPSSYHMENKEGTIAMFTT